MSLEEKGPYDSAQFIRSDTARSQNIFTLDLSVCSFTCCSSSDITVTVHLMESVLAFPPQFLHLNTCEKLQYLINSFSDQVCTTNHLLLSRCSALEGHERQVPTENSRHEAPKKTTRCNLHREYFGISSALITQNTFL